MKIRLIFRYFHKFIFSLSITRDFACIEIIITILIWKLIIFFFLRCCYIRIRLKKDCFTSLNVFFVSNSNCYINWSCVRNCNFCKLGYTEKWLTKKINNFFSKKKLSQLLKGVANPSGTRFNFFFFTILPRAVLSDSTFLVRRFFFFFFGLKRKKPVAAIIMMDELLAWKTWKASSSNKKTKNKKPKCQVNNFVFQTL